MSKVDAMFVSDDEVGGGGVLAFINTEYRVLEKFLRVSFVSPERRDFDWVWGTL